MFTSSGFTGGSGGVAKTIILSNTSFGDIITPSIMMLNVLANHWSLSTLIYANLESVKMINVRSLVIIQSPEVSK